MTFDELVSGGEAAVASLIGKQETLQLEFKANEPRDPIFDDGSLTKPGKKILAKEISAFANSAGGLLVFGVDCRVVDKVDQAEKLTPIPHLARAETALRDAAAELLQPRHDRIRVASIPSNEGEDKGYLIVDVPRSERRPHRSEAADQKQYFKRSGGSAFAMEHYDIEDAFRRVSSPSLKLEISYEPTMTIGWDEHHFQLKIAVENISDVTAKLISLQIWDRGGDAFGSDHQGTRIAKISHYDERLHLAGPVDFALHPGEKRLFHHFIFAAKTTPNGEVTIGNKELLPGSISFKYALSAENMRMFKGVYVLSKGEMSVFAAVQNAAQQRRYKSGY